MNPTFLNLHGLLHYVRKESEDNDATKKLCDSYVKVTRSAKCSCVKTHGEAAGNPEWVHFLLGKPRCCDAVF